MPQVVLVRPKPLVTEQQQSAPEQCAAALARVRQKPQSPYASRQKHCGCTVTQPLPLRHLHAQVQMRTWSLSLL